MNIESRKINLINWISTIQEDSILEKVEKIQKEKTDWWETLSDKDKKAINEGLDQLDRGEHLTQSEVRDKINKQFNFK